MQIDSEIRVMSWNVQNAGDASRRMECVTEVIDAHRPDVVYLAEVASNIDPLNTVNRNERITRQLQDIGLRTSGITPYGDARNRHCMTMAVADSVEEAPETLRLGGRSGWQANTSIGTIVGLHADDRYEYLRHETVLAALDLEPAVLMGDFNAIDHEAPRASLLRGISSLCVLLGIDAIDPYDDDSKTKRFLGKVVRLGGMAHSEVLDMAETHGLFAAEDDIRTPTIGHRKWGFTLDHILSRRGLIAIPVAMDFEPVSDHQPVVADIYKIA